MTTPASSHPTAGGIYPPKTVKENRSVPFYKHQVCPLVLEGGSRVLGLGLLIARNLLLCSKDVLPKKFGPKFEQQVTAICSLENQPFRVNLDPKAYYVSFSKKDVKRLDFVIIGLAKSAQLNEFHYPSFESYENVKAESGKPVKVIYFEERFDQQNGEKHSLLIEKEGTVASFSGSDGRLRENSHEVHCKMTKSLKSNAKVAGVFDNNRGHLLAIFGSSCKVEKCIRSTLIAKIIKYLKRQKIFVEIEAFRGRRASEELLAPLRKSYTQRNKKNDQWNKKVSEIAPSSPFKGFWLVPEQPRVNLSSPPTSVGLEQLFSSNDSQHVLIVDYMRIWQVRLSDYVVEEWAKRKLWKERFTALFSFDHIQLNRFADENPIQKDQFSWLAQAIASSETEIDVSAVVDTLRFSERLLFIIDGYEELSKSVRGLIDDVLKKKHDLLMVAPRLAPDEAFDDVSIDRCYELVGFIRENDVLGCSPRFFPTEDKVPFRDFFTTLVKQDLAPSLPLLEQVGEMWLAEHDRLTESLSDYFVEKVSLMDEKDIRKFIESNRLDAQYKSVILGVSKKLSARKGIDISKYFFEPLLGKRDFLGTYELHLFLHCFQELQPRELKEKLWKAFQARIGNSVERLLLRLGKYTPFLSKIFSASPFIYQELMNKVESYFKGEKTELKEGIGWALRVLEEHANKKEDVDKLDFLIRQGIHNDFPKIYTSALKALKNLFEKGKVKADPSGFSSPTPAWLSNLSDDEKKKLTSTLVKLLVQPTDFSKTSIELRHLSSLLDPQINSSIKIRRILTKIVFTAVEKGGLIEYPLPLIRNAIKDSDPKIREIGKQALFAFIKTDPNWDECKFWLDKEKNTSPENMLLLLEALVEYPLEKRAADLIPFFSSALRVEDRSLQRRAAEAISRLVNQLESRNQESLLKTIKREINSGNGAATKVLSALARSMEGDYPILLLELIELGFKTSGGRSGALEALGQLSVKQHLKIFLSLPGSYPLLKKGIIEHCFLQGISISILSKEGGGFLLKRVDFFGRVDTVDLPEPQKDVLEKMQTEFDQSVMSGWLDGELDPKRYESETVTRLVDWMKAAVPDKRDKLIRNLETLGEINLEGEVGITLALIEKILVHHKDSRVAERLVYILRGLAKSGSEKDLERIFSKLKQLSKGNKEATFVRKKFQKALAVRDFGPPKEVVPGKMQTEKSRPLLSEQSLRHKEMIYGRAKSIRKSLFSKNTQVRWKAAESLEDLATEVVGEEAGFVLEVVEAALGSKDQRVRLGAVNGLKGVIDTEALVNTRALIDLIKRVQKDKDHKVRYEAMQALKGLVRGVSKRDAKVLVDFLKQELWYQTEPWIRIGAADALVTLLEQPNGMNSAEAMNLLVKALKHPDNSVIMRLISGLKAIGDGTSVTNLNRVLKALDITASNKEFQIKWAAEQVFDRLIIEATGQMFRGMFDWLIKQLELSSNLNIKSALEDIIGEASDEDICYVEEWVDNTTKSVKSEESSSESDDQSISLKLVSEAMKARKVPGEQSKHNSLLNEAIEVL